jgi:hypothetical protein
MLESTDSHSNKGVPTKYYPGPMLLNFSVRVRISVSNMVTLLAVVSLYVTKLIKEF